MYHFFVQISEIAWEEFEKIGFQYFAKLRERNMEAEMAWPIPGDSGKFTECVDLRF